MKMTDEIPNEPFAAALKFCLKEKKKMKQKELAELVTKLTDEECSQKTISAMINAKTASTESKRRAVAKVMGYDYEDFLKFGEGIIGRKTGIVPSNLIKEITPSEQTQKQPHDLQEEIKARHHYIIEHFMDRNLALKFNELLVELERLDPLEYQELFEGTESKVKKVRLRLGIEPPQKNGTDNT